MVVSELDSHALFVVSELRRYPIGELRPIDTLGSV